MVDEKALAAACDAIAEAAMMDRDSVDEAVARAAITAYLQALAPPQMVKLSPEDERLLDKALSASSPAIYEIVPAALSPGSTGETEGWVLVPREPTAKMLAAGQTAWLADPCRKSSTLYRAMLSAAGER